MNNKKMITLLMLVVFLSGMLFQVQVSYAAAPSVDNIVKTLSSSTVSSEDSGGGLFENLFSLLFDKILGPLLNLVGINSSASTGKSPVQITPLPSKSADNVQDNGVLRGKVIVVDPGHGGSNPGAVGNNTREADNNLAVGLKLRDKLTKAGAKVIMTRESDRTVAPEGSSLGQELQARVDLAEKNNADIFVSVHSNSNPDENIYGAMTFYHNGKSPQLALAVQNALVKETGATDKGTSSATYYVLRNTSMPGILVEMGFVSNAEEAARLHNDTYRNNIAQGIFNGIVKYFNK